jgi:uncharacterized phage-like protein YoqJ
MFFLKLMNLYSAYGITLFAKKKEVILKIKMKIVNPLMALCNEIPADFIAANS